MSLRATFIIAVFLPFMAQASKVKICLGDNYETVKEIKGFPKKVSFINISKSTLNEKESSKFEAVSFYNDDMLYVFDSANGRLCQISNGANLKNIEGITCQKSFDKRQCH